MLAPMGGTVPSNKGSYRVTDSRLASTLTRRIIATAAKQCLAEPHPFQKASSAGHEADASRAFADPGKHRLAYAHSTERPSKKNRNVEVRDHPSSAVKINFVLHTRLRTQQP
jgi:hypothetical protein